MHSPKVLLPGDRLPSFQRWLIKPIAGAAGFGIREVYAARPSVVPEGCYGQEYVEGLSCSGLFVGHEEGCLFLGATTQLVGTPWLHATGYHYAGSVGLLELSDAFCLWFRDLGNILAAEVADVDGFGLRGIFGVDCILQPGVPWAIEINPRYTASVEVWEYARRRSALALHRRVFENLNDKAAQRKLQAMRISTGSRKVVGKAILYAREAVTIPAPTPWSDLKPVDPASFDMPAFADLPSVGDRIEKGHPILTFFAMGASTRDCCAELEKRAQDLDRWLYGS